MSNQVLSSLGKMGILAVQVLAKDVIGLVARAKLAMESFYSVTDVRKIFCEAKKSAKTTGKLLACSLAIGLPF